MTYRYISQINPIHREIEKINIEENFSLFWEFLRKRNIGWMHYGRFSPFPKSSVFISDELPILDKAINLCRSDDGILAFIYRKLSLYDIALFHAKKNYLKNPNSFEAMLEFGICLYLNKQNKTAIFIFNKAGEFNNNSNAFNLWFSYLFPIKNFDLNKNLAHYLKFNPLSLQNTDIVCKFEKKNSLNYHTILHYLETSPLAFIVSTNFGLTKFNYQEKKITNEIFNLISCHSNEILIRYDTLCKLSKFINFRDLIFHLSINNKIKITSELIAAFPKKFKKLNLTNYKNIVNIKKNISTDFKDFLDNDYFYNSISHPYIIKDSNTSDYSARFYSTNLNYKDSMSSELSVVAKKLFSHDYFHIAETIFNNSTKETSGNYDVWFDLSYSSLNSKIFKHLHTAGYDRTYNGTFVWYASVPRSKKRSGNLLIESCLKEESFFKPINNSIICFPSWFFHETTPIETSQQRITYNFDLITDQIFFPISFFI